MSGKPAVGLLVGLAPKGASESSGADGDSRSEARIAASQAILKAFKANDAKALDSALSAHYDACEMAGPDEKE